MFSSAASAACTLLMIASSALRCSVSFSSRCVSSKSRAFSSATPILAATVLMSRISASPDVLCRGVIRTNADVATVEHLAQFVADEIDDRLEVQLRGHSLLNSVDHRKLGRSLLLGLEQPLRLVEEPRILERDPHACGHRADEPN